MAYSIVDRLEVSILFNGQDYPIGIGQNTLSFIHLAASTKFKLPTVCFQVIDALNTLDRVNLQDALLMGISIRVKNRPTQVLLFRKFNHKKEFNGVSNVYTFDGYLNFPKFWLTTGSGGLRGTSDLVLRLMCQACDLRYDGVPTSDNQLWMQRNMTYADWARSIEAHGIVDRESFMKWGVQFNGVLTYRNVSALPKPQTKFVAYQETTDGYRVIDFRPTTKSGLNNAVSGYAVNRQQPSAVSADSKDDQVTVKANSRSPNINTKVKEEQGRGNVTYAPINFGNTHEDYERAYYQNQRIAALNSQSVEFLLDDLDITQLLLLDQFTFAVENDRQVQDVAYSGNYVTSSIVLYATGPNAYFKVEGTRMGTNLAYEAE